MRSRIYYDGVGARAVAHGFLRERLHIVWLIAIACATFASTVAGGALALRLRDQLHLILGFSAGAVLGVAFFDLLPESLGFGGGAGAATLLADTALGFFAYLVIDRVALVRTVETPATARRRPLGALLLCLHSLLDGIAIGLAFQASRAIGVVVAVAVLSHDFSDGINTMNLVLKSGTDRRGAWPWLLADAAAPAAGVIATLFFTVPSHAFGALLALFAGFFLYLGASELIPESYHAHPKALTTAMTLAGAALIFWAVRLAQSA